MLALIIYCRGKKLASGREIEGACYDDLGARLITGNRYPTRTVIDRFLKVHARALRGLLAQTLRLGAVQGLVEVAVVAGDGTKMQANASMDATVEESALHAQISALETKVAALSARWAEQVGDRVAAGGGGAYRFDEAELALSVHRARPQLPGPAAGLGVVQGVLSDHDEDSTLTASAGADSAEVTWRKLKAARGMLDARQAALRHLRGHPGRALIDWQDRVTRRRAKVTQIEQSMARTEADLHEQARRRAAAEAGGVKLPGTRPVAVPDHHRMRKHRAALHQAETRVREALDARPDTTRINTTDPASAIMPGKHDGFGQRHNVQALTCKNQFILAIGIHDSSNDKQALIALLHAARANLDAADLHDPMKVALFDSGYACESNFTADVPVHTLLIAVSRKHPTTTGSENPADADDLSLDTDEQSLPGPASSTAQAWQVMRERLDEPANRTLYKQRAAIIEPLFAQLFTRFGRNLTRRGPDVETELHLWAVTHNLLKISRHRRKTHPPG